MSKYAPVVPLAIAKELATLEFFGDYHLLISHVVNSDPQGWKELFDRERAKGKTPTIIMDNSLIELGEAARVEDVIRAADTVGADMIVLPDKLGDAIQTVMMSERAAEQFPNRPACGVVQGDGMIELIWCADRLSQIEQVEMLALPRIVTKMQGSRIMAAQDIWETTQLPIHLLGFSNNLQDDILAAAVPGVTGIDSAWPIWTTQTLGSSPPVMVPEDSRPADYWSWGVEQLRQPALHNIDRIGRWLRDLPWIPRFA